MVHETLVDQKICLNPDMADSNNGTCGELSMLWQVSEVLSQTNDLNNILGIILTGVTAYQGLGFNRAFLFLADEHSQNLKGEIAVGPGTYEEAGEIWNNLSEQNKSLTDILSDYCIRESSGKNSLTSLIRNINIPINADNLFGKAALDSEGVNIFYDQQLDLTTKEILDLLQSQNVAVAPILQKDKILGMIVADNRINNSPIKANDVKLLQTVANHSAMAIERSRLYDGLIEYNRQLETKNRLLQETEQHLIKIEKMSVIGELTSSVAHELRNPLTIIGGFANLIISSDSLNEYNEYLNIILSETKRAETVLEQLLDFSKAGTNEAGKIELNSLISNTFKIFCARLTNNSKPPEYHSSDKKAYIKGNQDQLRHAFYQFMNIGVDEIPVVERTLFFTERKDNKFRFMIEFQGDKSSVESIKKLLKSTMGTDVGTQKLPILIAGETIKYHGGNFGIICSENSHPGIFIELPLEVENHG